MAFPRGVVHSVLPASWEDGALALETVPEGAAMVEVRADRLRAGELAALVRIAPRPVVATVRAAEDGGRFDGTAAEKEALLRAALDAGAAFVDVEVDGPLDAWADGPDAPRVILSHHGAACDPAALASLFRRMSGRRAALLKIVPRAADAPEIAAVRDLLALARGEGRELAAFALGRGGAGSRILALLWGSWATYGSAAAGAETAEGQIPTRELLGLYRVDRLGPSTRLYGLVGRPVLESPSPALHAAGYRAAGLDAVYLPLETGRLDGLDALGLAGLGVTTPLKEEAAARSATLEGDAACGAVNTVTVDGGAWRGFNTDAPAALALIREALDPRGLAAAVVGAGGTGRAIGAALVRAGASVTIFNRDAVRADVTARRIGARSAPLERLAGTPWDLLVQATPIGRAGETLVPEDALRGRLVLDAAYGPDPTPLVVAARRRGLVAIDGLALLLAQALLQFERLTGRPAPAEAMAAASAPWRLGRALDGPEGAA